MRFIARAMMDGGKSYERIAEVFIAPHNPNVERRSGRTRLAKESDGEE